MESKDINEFTDCEYYNAICSGLCVKYTEHDSITTRVAKCSNIANCFIKDLYKQLQDKKQQYEELRQLHNSCCEEFKQEVDLRIDAYNKLSRDFFNSKYCNTEHCKLLQEKEKECENWQAELDKTHLLMLDKQDKCIQSLNENEELKKQLQEKQQECEALNEKVAGIIYLLTGGRLSYSTYTPEACEQAYHDQLEIDVERATKELQEQIKEKEQECEKLKFILKHTGLLDLMNQNVVLRKALDDTEKAVKQVKGEEV